MLLKILAAGRIVLFFVGVAAVLQGWSKSTSANHWVRVAFMLLLGVAEAGGARTLFGGGAEFACKIRKGRRFYRTPLPVRPSGRPNCSSLWFWGSQLPYGTDS